MPLDPQVKAFLDQMAGMPTLDSLSVADARAALLQLAAMQGTPAASVRTADHRIPGPACDIPVRVYTPPGRGPYPALVYFHGGGWVVGGIETHDGLCRDLATGVPAVVVSVDYRLAPEHRFPAAADDALAATRWVAAHAAELGADPRRLAVGGDSAGGNLSAVTALRARDERGPALGFQLLVYPVTDGSMDYPSYRENAEGYFLTRTMMEWFWSHYVPDPAARRHPHASPLRAESLRGLPPALVITAEFDPLRDEGEAYGARLREAGVAVEHTRYDGMVHGFFGMKVLIAQAAAAVDQAAAALRRALA
jgi:acetyl esterase